MKYLKYMIPGSLQDKLDDNPELKRLISNINWLFLDQIIQMAVAFFVGVWLIRYLGPEEYGALSYVVAFVALFSVVARFGVDGVAVREFVKNPEKKEEIFSGLFLIRLIGGILALFGSLIAMFFVRHGDTFNLILTLIIALGFVFQTSDVIDYWFQSKVMSKYVAYSKSATVLTSGIVKIVLILSGASLISFVFVILIESILNFLILGTFFIFNEKKFFELKFDSKISKEILRDSWPLALSSFAVILYMKIDQVMIGSMLGSEKLGQYSAAVSLSEMWYFFPTIISNSVFPAIIFSKKISNETYISRLQLLYAGMFWMAVFLAIPMTFFSKDIVNLLFGSAYSQSAGVLSVYVWAGIPVFLGVASGKFLVAENLTKIAFYRTLLGAIVNIALNLLLIPSYGIIGSAVATLISYSVATFSIVFFRKARVNIKLLFGLLNLQRIFLEYKSNIKNQI